jgi:hypothetical protein
MVNILGVQIRATVAVAFLSGMPMAWPQAVYRCAHLYSDRPCPGAVAIDTRDTRTPQEKAQSDAATQDIARTADRLERERRALENAQLRSAAARKPFAVASSPRSAGGLASGKGTSGRPPQPSQEPPFTAVARVPPPPAKSAAAPGPGG